MKKFELHKCVMPFRTQVFVMAGIVAFGLVLAGSNAIFVPPEIRAVHNCTITPRVADDGKLVSLKEIPVECENGRVFDNAAKQFDENDRALIEAMSSQRIPIKIELREQRRYKNQEFANKLYLIKK